MKAPLHFLLLELCTCIATAEACTSGSLASSFTELQGSSTYFIGGIVAYSKRVRRDILGVSKDTPSVSEKCAIEMSTNVSKLMRCRFGVSTTGHIEHGPVYCGLYDDRTKKCTVKTFKFKCTHRDQTKEELVGLIRRWIFDELFVLRA